MFRQACDIAKDFTIPIIILKKLCSGECQSAIAAGVVVNKEGWLLTANHVVKSIMALADECEKTQKLIEERRLVQVDSSLTDKEKRRKLNHINISPKQAESYTVCYGVFQGADVTTWRGIELVDLAVGKINGFDPTLIPRYPKFCDPARASVAGVSLCKLGFPFSSIVPSWDPLSNQFQFPQGVFPMPLFPLEGMYTRQIQFQTPPGVAVPNYPILMIETSSPGLKGQSGGPTFDVNGTIWAIQALTAHLELGFTPRVKGAGIEHQFLNVGMGAHVATILGLLDEVGAGYEMAVT